MKIKKTLSLLPVLLCLALSFYARAQERLWAVAKSGDLYSMNLDGSDVFSKGFFTKLDFGVNVGAFGIVKNASVFNGHAYLGTRQTSFSDGDGVISLLGPTGLTKLYNPQYLQGRAVDGIVDGPDGLFFPSTDVYGKWHGIIRIPYDGSSYQYFSKRSTDFSREIKMILVDGVVYGVSSGDSNNNGFIYRITPEELPQHLPVTRIFSFTTASDGLRPTGRLSYGNGFLFGSTSKGGLNNQGVFFKVKTDGTGYKKLFDLASNSITKQDATGKFQTLLDVVAEGYVPVIDQSGNYFVFSDDGIFRVTPSGLLIAKVSDVKADKIELISPQFQHVVKLLGVPNHATNVATHFSAQVTNFDGAGEFQLQLSTSPDFSANVTSLSSANTNFPLDLQSNTTYYTRARTDLWPYYGEVVSFTTENTTSAATPRLYISNSSYENFSVKTKTADDRFDFNASIFGSYHYELPIRPLANGDKIIIGPSSSEAYFNSLHKLTPNGLIELHGLDYTQDMYYEHAMIEGDDGYLYTLLFGVAGPHVYAFMRNSLSEVGESEYFPVSNPDLLLYAQLTKTPQGIYGVARGRTTNKGFVFKFRNDKSGIDIVHQFMDDGGGVGPEGEMVLGKDGFLYGTTRSGGQYDVGVIFKMSLSGDQYSELYSFQPSTGKNPEQGMFQDADGTLYGVTPLGGKNGYGVIFRINTDGTGFQKLFDFYTTGGKNRSGDFVMDDEYIYSISEKAGLFRINKDGSGYHPFGIPAMSLQLMPSTASNIAVVSPADGATSVDRDAHIELTPMPGAAWYSIQVSASPMFDNNVPELKSATPSFDVPNLLIDKTYYVRARCSLSDRYGKVSSFTTKEIFSYTTVIDPAPDATNAGTLNGDGVDVDFTFYPLPGATSYKLDLFLESQYDYAPSYTLYSNGSDPHVSVTGLDKSTAYITRVTTNLSPFSGQETYFTTTSEVEATTREGGVAAFPNPYSSTFSLQSGSDKILSATITDATGLVVHRQQQFNSSESLTMGEGLKRGIYVLKLRTEAGEKAQWDPKLGIHVT